MTAVAATEVAPAPRSAPGQTRRPHIDAVDVVRVSMVAGVIAVHVISYTTASTDAIAGAVTALLHVNREVFFFLTAFVLTYSYVHRHGWSLRRFWARRYPFVGAPYVVWTAVYFVANAGPWRPWAVPFHRFTDNLLQGTARYHLYFLLVTMQIYAVFPLLLWLLRASRRHHGILLAASFAVQEVFAGFLHYGTRAGLQIPWLLRPWLHHGDPLLPSYQLYIIAGGIAAMHLDELTGWVRAHRRSLTIWVAAGLAASLLSYALDHLVAGMDAPGAAEVFQPMMAVTSAAAIAGLFSLGLWWADVGPRRPMRSQVRAGSDATFGIYLAHPLLLQVLLIVAAPLVTPAAAGSIPSPIVLAVDLLIVVPVLLVASAVSVAWLRRTPASLYLTGRPALKPSIKPSIKASPAFASGPVSGPVPDPVSELGGAV